MGCKVCDKDASREEKCDRTRQELLDDDNRGEEGRSRLLTDDNGLCSVEKGGCGHIICQHTNGTQERQDAALKMPHIKLSFGYKEPEVTSPVFPFRASLHVRFKAVGLRPMGTCTRDGNCISIAFFLADVDVGRFHMILQELVQQYPQYLTETPRDILDRVQYVTKALPRGITSWTYEREQDSAGGEEYDVDALPEFTDQSKFRTLNTAVSADSGKTQKAHILFRNKYMDEMKTILREDVGLSETDTEEKLEKLLDLTADIGPTLHHHFDRLAFFWAFQWSRRAPGHPRWDLYLAPLFIKSREIAVELQAELGSLVDFAELAAGEEKTLWREALVLRKYLTLQLTGTGKYSREALRREWHSDSDQSECWYR